MNKQCQVNIPVYKDDIWDKNTILAWSWDSAIIIETHQVTLLIFSKHIFPAENNSKLNLYLQSFDQENSILFLRISRLSLSIV